MITIWILAGEAQTHVLKTRPPLYFQALDQEVRFWRQEKLWEEMEKNRKIMVSSHRKSEQWHFKGAGIVKVPRDFAFAQAKDFARLGQLPDHFSDISFDPETSILRMKVYLLKREKNLQLAMFEESTPEESRIYFRSLGPWLKGMEGLLLIKDLGRQSSEVGLISLYSGELDQAPGFVLSFGSEAVMHHVAESLRKSLESDYKLELK